MTTWYQDKQTTAATYTVRNSQHNDQFNNLNLNQNQSFFKNENAKSFSSTLSSSSSNAFNRSQQHNNDYIFDGRKCNNNFSNQKDEWSKKSFYNCNDSDNKKENHKLSSILSKTKETSNSTVSLHIAAYESDIVKASDVKDDEEEITVKSKKNTFGGKQWKNVKQLFTNSSMKYPFEIPRGNDDDDKKSAAMPEVMQFKASQKLLNPNALNRSQDNGQNNQIQNGGGGVDMETGNHQSNLSTIMGDSVNKNIDLETLILTTRAKINAVYDSLAPIEVLRARSDEQIMLFANRLLLLSISLIGESDILDQMKEQLSKALEGRAFRNEQMKEKLTKAVETKRKLAEAVAKMQMVVNHKQKKLEANRLIIDQKKLYGTQMKSVIAGAKRKSQAEKEGDMSTSKSDSASQSELMQKYFEVKNRLEERKLSCLQKEASRDQLMHELIDAKTKFEQ